MTEQEEFEFRARAEKERIAQQRAAPPPEKKMGLLDYAKEAYVGPLEVPAAMSSGLVSSVLGGLSGVGDIALGALGVPGRDPQANMEILQRNLTYQPRTKTAQAIIGGLSYPMEKVKQLGDWMGGKTTESFRQLGAPPEAAAGSGALVTTGVQALPMFVGRLFGGGPKPAKVPKVERQLAGDIQELLGPSKDKVIKALETYETRISKPTAEQAIAQYTRRMYKAGTPDEVGGVIAALKQELMKEPVIGDVAKSTAKRQQLARENVINAIAQTEDALNTAKQVRAETTGPMYGKVAQDIIDPRSNQQKIADMLYRAQEKGQTAAETKGIAGQRLAQETAAKDVAQTALVNMIGESDVGLANFVTRPVVRKAISRARKGALNKGEYFPETASDKFTVANLQRIKRAIASEVRQAKKEGTLDATEQAEITGTLSNFNDWIKARSKGYGEAEAAFAKLSEPINQMLVGKEFQKALTNSREQADPTAFLNARADAAKILKKSTGWNRYEKISDVLPEPVVKNLDKVAEELLDIQKSKEMASQTRSSMNEILAKEVWKFPNWLRRDISIANAILKKVAKNKSPEYKQKLSDLFDDPDRLAEALKMPKKTIDYTVAEEVARQLTLINIAKQAGSAGQEE